MFALLFRHLLPYSVHYFQGSQFGSRFFFSFFLPLIGCTTENLKILASAVVLFPLSILKHIDILMF